MLPEPQGMSEHITRTSLHLSATQMHKARKTGVLQTNKSLCLLLNPLFPGASRLPVTYREEDKAGPTFDDKNVDCLENEKHFFTTYLIPFHVNLYISGACFCWTTGNQPVGFRVEVAFSVHKICRHPHPNLNDKKHCWILSSRWQGYVVTTLKVWSWKCSWIKVQELVK